MQKNTIFVTGAASGIGKATALRFAQEGWFIGIADVNRTASDALRSEIGEANGIVLDLDVTDQVQWTEAVGQFAEATGGKMDILFNNAGIAKGGWFEDISIEDAHKVLDINLGGVVNGVYASLELLKATAAQKGVARIINTASVAGLVGGPKMAVYSATKFGVRGLTEALNYEFARHKISVTDIMPWFINTPLLEGALDGSNESINDSLASSNVKVYPVEDVVDKVWQLAAFDPGQGRIHHPVGGYAKVARVASNQFAGLLRRVIRRRSEQDWL